MSSYKKASKCLSWLIRPNKPLTLDNSSRISGSIAPSSPPCPSNPKGKDPANPQCTPQDVSLTHSQPLCDSSEVSISWGLTSCLMHCSSTLPWGPAGRHLSQSIFLPPWTTHRVKCFSPLFHLKYVCWPRTFSFPTYLVRNNKFSDLNSQYI